MMKTERLCIRRFQETDLDDLALLIRDKMASEYAPYDTQWPIDNSKDILAYFISDDAWYAVELIEKNKVIGFVVASHTEDETTRDLGFTIHSSYQNRGYAYEACCALINICANKYGIKKFTAGTADCNGPSVALLNKLGFTKTLSFEASFANNAQGKPITFLAGAYERNLTPVV